MSSMNKYHPVRRLLMLGILTWKASAAGGCMKLHICTFHASTFLQQKKKQQDGIKHKRGSNVFQLKSKLVFIAAYSVWSTFDFPLTNTGTPPGSLIQIMKLNLRLHKDNLSKRWTAHLFRSRHFLPFEPFTGWPGSPTRVISQSPWVWSSNTRGHWCDALLRN